MSLRHDETTLAHSPDGRSVLVQDEAQGPEGGGSLTYRVTGGKAHEFVISSDFSPGDGSTPQAVSEKECRARLAELSALLTQLGFTGVAVHPEACARQRRSGAVTVAAAPAR